MGLRVNCPVCGAFVDAREATSEGNYPGAMVFRTIQVRLGPEHRRVCRHWREKEPDERPA
jgi:hypothetical protein